MGAHDYFNRKFGEDLEVAVSAFKFARFLTATNKKLS